VTVGDGSRAAGAVGRARHRALRGPADGGSLGAMRRRAVGRFRPRRAPLTDSWSRPRRGYGPTIAFPGARAAILTAWISRGLLTRVVPPAGLRLGDVGLLLGRRWRGHSGCLLPAGGFRLRLGFALVYAYPGARFRLSRPLWSPRPRVLRLECLLRLPRTDTLPKRPGLPLASGRPPAR